MGRFVSLLPCDIVLLSDLANHGEVKLQPADVYGFGRRWYQDVGLEADPWGGVEEV